MRHMASFKWCFSSQFEPWLRVDAAHLLSIRLQRFPRFNAISDITPNLGYATLSD